MDKVVIYADGSCIRNGYPEARGAAAAIIESAEGEWLLVGEYLGHSTNQQAEIVAAALGLEILETPSEVTIFSDSQYLIFTMAGKYRRRRNFPFWERLDMAIGRHQVTFKWIRGHIGHRTHDAADKAAYMIAAGRVHTSELSSVAEFIGASVITRPITTWKQALMLP